MSTELYSAILDFYDAYDWSFHTTPYVDIPLYFGSGRVGTARFERSSDGHGYTILSAIG